MNWIQVIIFTLIFCVTTAGSIVLLGDRELISGNLFSMTKFIGILSNWKFILAMILAIVARMAFVLINNNLLKIPKMAASSTTATAFITTIAYAVIIISNWLFLNEKMTPTQLIGCATIIVGTIFIVK